MDRRGLDRQDGVAGMAGRREASASRRDRKKARTRREIFRAAMGLFRVHGFDAVTVDRICESADVARGTFFLHYPSKSELLRELELELVAEFRERLRGARRSTLSECRALLDCLVERARSEADLLGAMLREHLGEFAPASAAPRSGDGLRGVVAEVVARGQRRGELRRGVSPPLAATLLWAGLTAAVFAAADRRGGATPQQIRSALLDALLHGLLEPKPRLVWSPERRGAST